jgi:hypothetical protein
LATTAPRVEGVLLQPRLGQVLVTFLVPPDGLNPASLVDPANYAVHRVRGSGGQDLTVVRLTAAAVAPGGTQTVTLQLASGTPLRPLRHGVYELDVRSGGVASASGVPLDGDYTSTLPSGDGQPGGDFRAYLLTNSLVVFRTVPRGPFLFFGFQPRPAHDIQPYLFAPPRDGHSGAPSSSGRLD